MLSNTVRFYCENFQIGLKKIDGMCVQDRASLSEKIEDYFYRIPENIRPLPPEFFQIDRSVRILSRMEAKPTEQILKDIVQNPALLFEVHDIPLQNFDEPAFPSLPEKCQNPSASSETAQKKAVKSIPTDDVIYEAMGKCYAQDGKLPNHYLSRVHLPENSHEWGRIRQSLRERGLTLYQFYKNYKSLSKPPKSVEKVNKKNIRDLCMIDQIIHEGFVIAKHARQLPSARSGFNKVAGMSVVKINKKIRDRDFENIDKYIEGATPAPKNLNELFLQVGIAKNEGGKFIPAPVNDLKKLEARFG